MHAPVQNTADGVVGAGKAVASRVEEAFGGAPGQYFNIPNTAVISARGLQNSTSLAIHMPALVINCLLFTCGGANRSLFTRFNLRSSTTTNCSENSNANRDAKPR